MKYYLIHVQRAAGSEAKTIFDYATRDAAEISFHQEVAYDMGNANMEFSLVQVINETGAVEPGLTKVFTRA